MSDLDSRCLDAFPEWLKTLADDTLLLSSLLEDQTLSDDVRRPIAGAVNYLFKSLDLIPDGIEDLGFIDDAFVLRVAASIGLGANNGAGDVDSTGTVKKLAEEARLVSDFLGEEYVRLERFVRTLVDGTVRGRSVEAVLTDEAIRSQLLGELRGWASTYQPPGFSRDQKTLIKLRSFLAAKLPA